MERYWIPSTPESALFGTQDRRPLLPDQHRRRHRLPRRRAQAPDRARTGSTRSSSPSTPRASTSSREALRGDRLGATWRRLAGDSRARRWTRFARAARRGQARRARLEHGRHPARRRRGQRARDRQPRRSPAGCVGREGCGLMPIRGHSGVQGGAEMGCYATAFPGGVPVNAENAASSSEQWGFEVPDEPGLTAPEMLDAAARGELDVLFAVRRQLPRRAARSRRASREALGRIPLRVHMDIVALRADARRARRGRCCSCPATTRYEIPGGVTETTHRAPRDPQPRDPGPADRRGAARVGGASASSRRGCGPSSPSALRFDGTPAIRAEIAEVVPLYARDRGAARGRRLVPVRRARTARRATTSRPRTARRTSRRSRSPEPVADGRHGFALSTRRGKQFNSMVQETTRLDHRRDARGGADQRRRRRAAGHRRRRRGAAAQRPRRAARPRRRSRRSRPATLQVHWPEGNVLIGDAGRSPEAGIPDYNARVDDQARWADQGAAASSRSVGRVDVQRDPNRVAVGGRGRTRRSGGGGAPRSPRAMRCRRAATPSAPARRRARSGRAAARSSPVDRDRRDRVGQRGRGSASRAGGTSGMSQAITTTGPVSA